MKKIALICFFCMACLLLSFVGCGKEEPKIPNESEPCVVIKAETSDITPATTLKLYMDSMVASGKLAYTMESGMVTSVNGIKAEAGIYWMLYTDDAEYAVNAWGTLEYEGVVYGSASVGATELIVKQGATYIWCLQKP